MALRKLESEFCPPVAPRALSKLLKSCCRTEMGEDATDVVVDVVGVTEAEALETGSVVPLADAGACDDSCCISVCNLFSMPPSPLSW